MTSQTYRQHLRDEHGIGKATEFLREIVYGANDGIVTTFAIVAGFAGAGAEGAAMVGSIAVLLFGLANLFADAASMGLGAFLSGRSERDLYMAVRASEMNKIAETPAAERQEVVEILGDRGCAPDDIPKLADLLQRNPELMADFMMQYEFGMADPREQNPAMNGFATFSAFLVFGAVPLLPYMLLEPVWGTFQLSVFATATALVLLGMLRWRVTGEGLLRSVGETVMVGGTCAVIAYGVGLAFAH